MNKDNKIKGHGRGAKLWCDNCGVTRHYHIEGTFTCGECGMFGAGEYLQVGNHVIKRAEVTVRRKIARPIPISEYQEAVKMAIEGLRGEQR